MSVAARARGRYPTQVPRRRRLSVRGEGGAGGSVRGKVADVGVPFRAGQVAAGDSAGGGHPVIGLEVPDLDRVLGGGGFTPDGQPLAVEAERHAVRLVVRDRDRGTEADAGGDVVEPHFAVAAD